MTCDRAPYVVRRNGDVLDRATRRRLGHVLRDDPQGSGRYWWIAAPPYRRCLTRDAAAREVYAAASGEVNP